MSTNLVVEDGSIVSGANSYVSLTDAQTYWGNWGYSVTGYTSTQQTNALYYSAYAMEKLYGRFYIGRTAKYSPQALLWPRQFDSEVPTVVLANDATGQGAKFYVRVIDGVVSNVYIVNGGANYTAPTLTVYDSQGTGATVAATVTAGVITSVTITNGGENYCTPEEINANDHTVIAIDEIPQCLKDAQCEVAYLSLTGSNIFPEVSDEQKLKLARDQIGNLNFYREYQTDRYRLDGERIQGFRKVELILSPIINSQYHVYA
jgi:hypothetical protein